MASKKVAREKSAEDHGPFFILGIIGVCASVVIGLAINAAHDEAQASREAAQETHQYLMRMDRQVNQYNVYPEQLNYRLEKIEMALSGADERSRRSMPYR